LVVLSAIQAAILSLFYTAFPADENMVPVLHDTQTSLPLTVYIVYSPPHEVTIAALVEAFTVTAFAGIATQSVTAYANAGTALLVTVIAVP